MNSVKEMRKMNYFELYTTIRHSIGIHKKLLNHKIDNRTTINDNRIPYSYVFGRCENEQIPPQPVRTFLDEHRNIEGVIKSPHGRF